MAIYAELSKKVRDDIPLYVFENILQKDIQRIFFLKNLGKKDIRGGNTSKYAYEGIICIEGSCKVVIQKEGIEEIYVLDNPMQCVIVEPMEWHQIYDFAEGSMLLAFSDRKYDVSEYI